MLFDTLTFSKMITSYECLNLHFSLLHHMYHNTSLEIKLPLETINRATDILTNPSYRLAYTIANLDA